MTVKNNKKIKVVVLCIVVATTFWFFNAMNNHYTSNVNFPLKYNVASPQLKLTSSVPKKIGINVYGTGWDIVKVSLGFGYEPYFFNLDKEKAVDFKSSTLMPYISHELAKLKVNFIHEGNWKIQTDSVLTKKISLEGLVQTESEDFVSLYSPVVSPDSILVTGPRLYLDSLDQEMVLTINNIKTLGQHQLDIKIKDWINSELKSSIAQVRVDFTIDKLIEESDILYNQDSSSRQLVKYTKPDSFMKLDQVQLNTSISNPTSIPFYTIISTELDSTYSLKDE